MILIGNTIISEEIFERFFVCDLIKCKGACCVEGDLGAPLDESELPLLENIYEKVKPYLSSEGIEAIEKEGLYVKDFEGDFSTPTIHGKECAYAVYDDRGVLRCGLELAHQDGMTIFRKPVSCHLYPVRVKKIRNMVAVNYDNWHICNPACDLGEKLGVPVYEFLREALTRKFGRDWYRQLVAYAREEKGNTQP
jgi:hypothetical protein